MSLFEFLMVLVSLIVGLGMAEILSGVARMIRCRDSLQPYWVHSVVVIAIFLALLQQWWEIWSLRDTPQWSFIGLIMMLAGPVGLFIFAHLLFPEPMRAANIREYYYGVTRPIWLVAAATAILATSFRPLVFDTELMSPDNATSFVLVIAFVALAVTKRALVHACLVPVLLLLLLIDIVYWTYVIG